ncbi:hypothetical protein BDV59DRAFT_176124 [Aspergillus ambiguus]|uniref:uncharacterized protein n=1 Tax=Aspergillus ambiguus TaxID=176160 RepID=UPI003CCD185A
MFGREPITHEEFDHSYPGFGTHNDLYLIFWIPNNSRNPMLFQDAWKWSLALLISFDTLAKLSGASSRSPRGQIAGARNRGKEERHSDGESDA